MNIGLRRERRVIGANSDLDKFVAGGFQRGVAGYTFFLKRAPMWNNLPQSQQLFLLRSTIFVELYIH